MGGTGSWEGVWAESGVCPETWEGSVPMAGPPMCLLCVCSFFGRAFEKAAEGTNSRTLHNYFDFSGKNPMYWGPIKVSTGLGSGKLASLEIPCQQPFHPAGTSPEPGFSRQLRMLWNASGPDRLPGEETGVAQEPIGLALAITSPTSLEDWPLTRASRAHPHPLWSTTLLWVVETPAPKLSTPKMAK